MVTPHGVTGDELRVEGDKQLSFTINGEEFVHAFCVCKIANEADAILGTDFLGKRTPV
jgi:heme/copper-type cytochrome/quinol oxidase subunit 2